MTTRENVLALNTEQLCEILEEKVVSITPDTLSTFRQEKITGADFLDLTDGDLKELVKTLGERKQIQRVITSYKPSKVR